MRIPMFLCAAGLAAALAFAPSTASAQPVDAGFTYQGRLAEAGVAANGLFEFRFALYDVTTGGSPVSVVITRNITVQNGLFQTNLDFSSAAYAPGTKRFLQVDVRPAGSGGPYETLGARQEITATPFAVRTLIPQTFQETFNASLGADPAITTGGTPITIAGNNFFRPALSVANSAIEWGNASGFGALIGRSGGDLTRASAYVGVAGFGPTSGDVLLLGRTSGMNLPDFQPDATVWLGPGRNTSGLLQLFDQGTVRVDLDADVDNTNNPRLLLSANADSVTLAPGAPAANDRVILPNNSITAPEIADEPGVAEFYNPNTIGLLLNGLYSPVGTVTITAPAAGHVIVFASATLNVTHTTGTISDVDFALRRQGSINTPRVRRLTLASTLPSGSLYYLPVALQGTFSVAAGANTFEFAAARFSGGTGSIMLAQQVSLTAVFVPTTYGTISARPLPPNTDRFNTPRVPPMSPQDIAAERDRSMDADMARVLRELNQVQERLREIEAERAAEKSQRLGPAALGNGGAR